MLSTIAKAGGRADGGLSTITKAGDRAGGLLSIIANAGDRAGGLRRTPVRQGLAERVALAAPS